MKKRMRIPILMLFFLAAAAAGAMAGEHQAEEAAAQKLLVTLMAADSQARGMALVLANQAIDQGAEVRVLLCGDGARLALTDYNPPRLKPRDVTPVQLLDRLMKNGVKVEVCAIFLPNTGYSEDDLSDGIGVADPADVANYMMQPDVKLFSQ